MWKLKTYLHSLRASLTDPGYYFTLRSTRAFFSIQFFLFSLFLIALGEIANWNYRLLPTMTAAVRTETNQAIAQVPEDAVFGYDGNTLVTNGVSLPLTITSSQTAQDHGFPKNLVEVTKEEKASGNSLLTLTPTHAMFHMDTDPAGETTYSDIFGDMRGNLSRDQIRTAANTLFDTIIMYRLQIAIIFALFGLLSSIFTGIITILLYSVIVQVIGWVLDLRLTYRYALRWGLHIFPIALAIQEISSVIAPDSSFPILSVTYIAMAVLIIWIGRSERPTIVFQ